jgi:hypothetical protein
MQLPVLVSSLLLPMFTTLEMQRGGEQLESYIRLMFMKRRLRLIGLIVTALLPGFLKRMSYRWLFGYRIGRDVQVGVALLDCKSLTMGDGTSISHGVVMWRCGEFHIGNRVSIGPLNLFRRGDRLTWKIMRRLSG